MNRDFDGILIPKSVWLDENLTPLDKVIFAELTQHGAICDLNTIKLAEFCKCDEEEVTQSLMTLFKHNYIKVVGGK